MKLYRIALAVIIAVTAFAADKPATPATPANPAFEKVKSLAGDWETKMPDGTPVINTFQVIAEGSAVVIHENHPQHNDEMLTIVHPDGEKLIATHYCAAKNQPRFEAVPSSDPNKLVFKLKDITNLASPNAGHMTGMVLTIVDKDHHDQQWTFLQGGKEMVETFKFARKK